MISIIIIHYGKKELLDKCLNSIKQHKNKAKYEIIIINNNKNNRGFSKACNKGVKKAKGDYYLFLNNDCEIFKDYWLDELITDKNTITGIEASYKDVKTGFIDWKRTERGFYNFITGCCMLVPKNIYWKVGGFDERYFMYSEDADFCLTAQEKRFNIKLIETDKIKHDLNHNKPLKQRLMSEVSRLKYVRKYWGNLRMLQQSLVNIKRLNRLK
jgi:GT2 family glycosyltransferase